MKSNLLEAYIQVHTRYAKIMNYIMLAFVSLFRPSSSLLQGLGMTGGAMKMGFLGGMFGSLFEEEDNRTKLQKCLDKVDSYTDSEVLKIVKGNYEATLQEFEKLETLLQSRTMVALLQKKLGSKKADVRKDLKLRNDITSFLNDHSGVTKDRNTFIIRT